MSLLEDINIFTKIPFSDLCITTGNFWRVVIHKDYDLKKLRLAISDEPASLNPKESSSPQSSDLYIHDDKLFVNELFFSLLHRGEIDFYKLNHLPFSEDDTAFDFKFS